MLEVVKKVKITRQSKTITKPQPEHHGSIPHRSMAFIFSTVSSSFLHRTCAIMQLKPYFKPNSTPYCEAKTLSWTHALTLPLVGPGTLGQAPRPTGQAYCPSLRCRRSAGCHKQARVGARASRNTTRSGDTAGTRTYDTRRASCHGNAVCREDLREADPSR